MVRFMADHQLIGSL